MRVVHAGTVAIAVVAFAVCAPLLLRDAVPSGLELPSIDEDAIFGAEEVSRAERFERGMRILWILAELALLAVLVVYARRGARFLRESAAGAIGSGVFLGMIGLALVWLAQLPFSVAAHWWARRYDVTDVGYGEYLFGDWLLLGGTFLFISLWLLVIMALARWLGQAWWLPGAAVFTALVALFAFVMPWLGSDEPLDDPALVATGEQYARAQGTAPIELRVEDVGDTDLANAYAFGYGPSRRIVFWNTLLEDFDEGEVEVVLAHEIAHHSSDHILEGIAWFALFALPTMGAIAWATRRRGGMARPEAVPVALLAAVVLQLVLSPVENAISRQMEVEADWKALETTKDAESTRGLFVRFGDTSLSDPSPPLWAHLLLDSHPSLADRVAMAEAWERRSARAR